jgi:hypothetical protein
VRREAAVNELPADVNDQAAEDARVYFRLQHDVMSGQLLEPLGNHLTLVVSQGHGCGNSGGQEIAQLVDEFNVSAINGGQKPGAFFVNQKREKVSQEGRIFFARKELLDELLFAAAVNAGMTEDGEKVRNGFRQFNGAAQLLADGVHGIRLLRHAK